MNTCIMKMSAKTIVNSYFCPKNHLFKYEEVPLRTTPINQRQKNFKDSNSYEKLVVLL